MTEFVVVRFTNRVDGTFGNVVHNFDNESDAIKNYFREAGKAVDSTHLTDSVSLLTKEGFEIRHDYFTHEAPQPEPEPETEEPVEETAE